jgi:hypothetical protein
LLLLIAAGGCTRKKALDQEPRSPYTVRHASSAIVIDGSGDDEAWKEAPRSPSFAPAEGGPPVAGDAHARLLWDEQNLYALVEIEDQDVYSPYRNRDDPLWKADCVEFFIDADGNGRGYVELQVNPNNAQFDAWFPQTRAQKSHVEWNAAMKSSVAVHGTLDNRDDRDEGWTVEAAIPLETVKGMDAAMAVHIPPQRGDRWRLNVVRIDGEGPYTRGSASSWNPIPIQDFHALSRMLTVVFE